jgi:hypothetical protein
MNAKVNVESAKAKHTKSKTPPHEMLHLSEHWKQVLGWEISRSGSIEIISPVPETVTSKKVTKASSSIGSIPSNLKPVVEVAIERKEMLLKRFSRAKKGREK